MSIINMQNEFIYQFTKDKTIYDKLNSFLNEYLKNNDFSFNYIKDEKTNKISLHISQIVDDDNFINYIYNDIEQNIDNLISSYTLEDYLSDIYYSKFDVYGFDENLENIKNNFSSLLNSKDLNIDETLFNDYFCLDYDFKYVMNDLLKKDFYVLITEKDNNYFNTNDFISLIQELRLSCDEEEEEDKKIIFQSQINLIKNYYDNLLNKEGNYVSKKINNLFSDALTNYLISQNINIHDFLNINILKKDKQDVIENFLLEIENSLNDNDYCVFSYFLKVDLNFFFNISNKYLVISNNAVFGMSSKYDDKPDYNNLTLSLKHNNPLIIDIGNTIINGTFNSSKISNAHNEVKDLIYDLSLDDKANQVEYQLIDKKELINYGLIEPNKYLYKNFFDNFIKRNITKKNKI